MTLKTCVKFVLLFLPLLSFGQTFRFHNYTVEEGIAQGFIYSVNQDEHGYLWVGTGEGLCKFDGESFKTYTTNEGLGDNMITSSFHSEDKSLWFGHNNGGITQYKNDEFITYQPGSHGQSTVNGFCEIGNSIFYIVQNEGLFSLSNEKVSFLGSFNLDGFYSIKKIDNSNIIIGTSSGLIHISDAGPKWRKIKTYFQDEWVSCITETSEDGIFLVGMQTGGLSKLRLKDDVLEFSKWDGIDLSEVAIKTVVEDNQHNLWLGTFGQGVIKLHVDTTGNLNGQITNYNSSTGLAGDFVQSVFQDREGNIWIGTFGDGLSTLIDDFFTFYSHSSNANKNSVSSLWIDDQNNWFGVENGLIRVPLKSDEESQFYTDSNGFVKDNVQALHQIDSTLWIGTANKGLFRLNINSGDFSHFEIGYGTLENIINQITSDGEYVYVATEGGVLMINIRSEETLLVNTESGLAHNSTNTVFLDAKGSVWVGGHSRHIYSIYNLELSGLEIESAGEVDVMSITEDLQGNLWIATSEKGIYKYDGTSFTNYNTTSGLFSDYVYALKEDGHGNLWTGHRGGLSKLNIANEKIEVFDHRDGIKGQVSKNSMLLDKLGYLWIGNTEGSIKYDPNKDKLNEVAPIINLLTITVGDKVYTVGEDIELPYGKYRVQFDYAGISFKHPDEIKYQFKLEGHDDVYSDLTSATSATYGRLTDGEYAISIIAYNEDGIFSENKSIIKINIATPIWKKWWFYVIIFIVIFSIVLFLVRARIKRLKENQIYLEEQLDIKTKEVVEKATRIEEINKDLTGSINYAQRIQSSVLPDLSILENALPNSFIFFEPRDIVSGDFYYLEKIGDKLIVACCDCTGHGVPGAIMSMIGSVTLHNIYSTSKYEWRTPEKVLEKLDDEVKTILQQRQEDDFDSVESLFRPKDGMDMTLCEIDLKTNEVLLAGAMRNSMIIRGGEMEAVTGDKRPIGGNDYRDTAFTLQKFQMNPGDELYMYSDGYPDQFGGERGRKLKMSGTKKIFSYLNNLDIEDYHDFVSDQFQNWKGDEEQTDDVLMIGLLF